MNFAYQGVHRAVFLFGGSEHESVSELIRIGS